MKQLYYSLVLLTLLACGETNGPDKPPGNGKIDEIDSTATIDTAVTDLTEVKIEPVFLPVYNRFKPTDTNKPILDTSYIRGAMETVTEQTRLRSTEVHDLTQKLSNTDESAELTWSLTTFHKLDSLEHAGALQTYHENLDIGMMKSSKAYAIDRIKLDGETLLIWGITYQTYEACPYAEGTTLLGTLVYKGKAGETFYLGEDSYASDPPVGFSKYTTTAFKGDRVQITMIEINTDEEPETMETIETVDKKTLTYLMSEGKLSEL